MRSVPKIFMSLGTMGRRGPYSPGSTRTLTRDYWTLSVTVPTSMYVLDTVFVSVAL
jgi:hypothetical protein